MTFIHTLILSIFLSAPGATADDPLKTIPKDDARRIAASLPGVVLGPESSVPKITNAADWLPLESTVFVFDHPTKKDKTLKHVLTKIDRAPGSKLDAGIKGWAIELPSGTTRFLKQDGENGLVAATDVSKPNAFIIRLSPPEPIVHASTTAKNEVSEEIKISICDLDSPTDVSYSGQVKCTWTDLGGWKVKVPHGTYDTRLIKISYDGSIGPASVSAWKYMFLAKGVGPVAFTDSRDISAFIFYNNDTDHAGVLRSLKRASDG
ncbi:MAG: hypothetical protein O3A31_03190 [Planctomycetota bacterium]|nr:hypothetical protein [Planctomycetota bacterium]